MVPGNPELASGAAASFRKPETGQSVYFLRLVNNRTLTDKQGNDAKFSLDEVWDIRNGRKTIQQVWDERKGKEPVYNPIQEAVKKPKRERKKKDVPGRAGASKKAKSGG
jgi:hypothetical protein